MTEDNPGVLATDVTVRWTNPDGERWQASLEGETLVRAIEKPRVELRKNALLGVVRPKGPYQLELGPTDTLRLQVLSTTLWRRWRHRLFEVERLRKRVHELEASVREQREQAEEARRQLRVSDEKLHDVARALRGTERGRDA